MKEFTDSFKLMFIERTSSPFMAIFATAWLSFNWRAVLLITWGEGSINERIALLDTTVLEDGTKLFINFYPNLIYPFFTALALIIAYPVITIGPFWLWKWFNRKKEEIVENLDLNKRISTETYQQLLLDRKEMRETYNGSVAEYKDAEQTAKRDLAAALEKRDEAVKNANELFQGAKENTQNIHTLNETIADLQEQKRIAIKDLDKQKEEQVMEIQQQAALQSSLQESQEQLQKSRHKIDELGLKHELLVKTNNKHESNLTKLQNTFKVLADREGEHQTLIAKLKAKITELESNLPQPISYGLGSAALPKSSSTKKLLQALGTGKSKQPPE